MHNWTFQTVCAENHYWHSEQLHRRLAVAITGATSQTPGLEMRTASTLMTLTTTFLSKRWVCSNRSWTFNHFKAETRMWRAPPHPLGLMLTFFLLFVFCSPLFLVEAVPRHQPGQQEVSAPLALRPATWTECSLPYEHYRSPKHHHPSGFIHHLIHLPRDYQSGSLHHHHHHLCAHHHYCSPHHYKVSGTWTHCWDEKKCCFFFLHLNTIKTPIALFPGFSKVSFLLSFLGSCLSSKPQSDVFHVILFFFF